MNVKKFNSGLFWTVFLGLTAIVISVILFVISKEEREPVYSVTKSPSLIFNGNISSNKLKLIIDDSILVQNNVYTMNLFFWNNGNKEISFNDIRKTFTIKPKENFKILDYFIIEKSTSEISNFRMNFKDDNVEIKWDFFDPNHGFEMQIIYISAYPEGLIIEGEVLGNSLRKVDLKPNFGAIQFISIIFMIAIFGFSIFFSKAQLIQILDSHYNLKFYKILYY